MGLLLGVHGIWQQQSGRNQLLARWVPALADGLERACGRQVASPPLEVVFYGDLFLAMDAEGGKAGPSAGSMLQFLADDEVADLVAAAEEVLTPADLEAADAVEFKGYNQVPLPLQHVLRALDLRFGAAAGVLYLGEFRQVRRYLCDSEIKQIVDARVAAALTEGTRILIGHSLGSVVAFEHVRQHPEHSIDLLLTLGSPLCLRMVRDRMPDPAYGTVEGKLPNVASWVNIRDPRDPVACAGGLGPFWSGVSDREVDNQADAHGVERYLSKQVTGAALLAAIPELGGR